PIRHAEEKHAAQLRRLQRPGEDSRPAVSQEKLRRVSPAAPARLQDSPSSASSPLRQEVCGASWDPSLRSSIAERCGLPAHPSAQRPASRPPLESALHYTGT